MGCNCGKKRVTQAKKTIKPSQKLNGDNTANNSNSSTNRIRRIIRRAAR